MNHLVSRFLVRGWFVAVAVAASLSGCVGGHATVTPRAEDDSTLEERSLGDGGAGNETLPWSKGPWSKDPSAEPGPAPDGPPMGADNDTVEDEPGVPPEDPEEPGLLDDDSMGASDTGALEAAVEDAAGEAEEPLPDEDDAMNGVNSTVEKSTG